MTMIIKAKTLRWVFIATIVRLVIGEGVVEWWSDRRYDDLLPDTIKAISGSPLDCAGNCTADKSCESFFTWVGNRCYLSDVIYVLKRQLIEGLGAHYFRRKQGASCPDKLCWHQSRTNPLCYAFFKGTDTYRQSNHVCRSNGGRLANLPTKAMTEYMTRQISYNMLSETDRGGGSTLVNLEFPISSESRINEWRFPEVPTQANPCWAKPNCHGDTSQYDNPPSEFWGPLFRTYFQARLWEINWVTIDCTMGRNLGCKTCCPSGMQVRTNRFYGSPDYGTPTWDTTNYKFDREDDICLELRDPVPAGEKLSFNCTGPVYARMLTFTHPTVEGDLMCQGLHAYGRPFIGSFTYLGALKQFQPGSFRYMWLPSLEEVPATDSEESGWIPELKDYSRNKHCLILTPKGYRMDSCDDRYQMVTLCEFTGRGAVPVIP